jgi:acyl carrier protein
MREEVRRILLDVLELDTISETDTIDTVEKWDSVRHLKLVMAVEEHFGVAFEANEIFELSSLDAIVGAVSRRGAATA